MTSLGSSDRPKGSPSCTESIQEVQEKPLGTFGNDGTEVTSTGRADSIMGCDGLSSYAIPLDDPADEAAAKMWMLTYTSAPSDEGWTRSEIVESYWARTWRDMQGGNCMVLVEFTTAVTKKKVLQLTWQDIAPEGERIDGKALEKFNRRNNEPSLSEELEGRFLGKKLPK